MRMSFTRFNVAVRIPAPLSAIIYSAIRSCGEKRGLCQKDLGFCSRDESRSWSTMGYRTTAATNSMPRDAEHFHQDLARLASEGANSERIAYRAALAWRNLDVALSPIIGQGGVMALFRRSVSMTRTTHPWLASMQEELDQLATFAALQAALSQQTGVEAAAGNSAVLRKFLDILTSLIGESLAERLLSSVWDDSSHDDDMRETSR
jgi:hypothetical protein